MPAKQTVLVQNTSAVQIVLLPHSNVRAALNNPGKGSRQGQHARGCCCWRGTGEQNSHPLGQEREHSPTRAGQLQPQATPATRAPPDLGSPVRGGSRPGEAPPEAWCRNTSPGSSARDASDPQSKRRRHRVGAGCSDRPPHPLGASAPCRENALRHTTLRSSKI